MKDFTEKQAAAWVEQEMRGVHAKNAAARLASEREMVNMAQRMGWDKEIPNSNSAHIALIERIIEKFGDVDA